MFRPNGGLWQARSDDEEFCQHAHQDRAKDVDGQRARGKAEAKQARGSDIDAMPVIANNKAVAKPSFFMIITVFQRGGKTGGNCIVTIY